VGGSLTSGRTGAALSLQLEVPLAGA
jgi:hypothetical protein